MFFITRPRHCNFEFLIRQQETLPVELTETHLYPIRQWLKLAYDGYMNTNISKYTNFNDRQPNFGKWSNAPKFGSIKLEMSLAL